MLMNLRLVQTQNLPARQLALAGRYPQIQLLIQTLTEHWLILVVLYLMRLCFEMLE